MKKVVFIEKYRFGFDPWGLILFLMVMLPNFFWFAVHAPNDVLRKESLTPIVDTIGSVFQVLFIACMCLLINNERSKTDNLPLIIVTIASVVLYYISWTLYYAGITSAWVILMLTLAPCVAFLLFAIGRKNLPAIIFAICFTICHLIFGIVNFIV